MRSQSLFRRATSFNIAQTRVETCLKHRLVDGNLAISQNQQTPLLPCPSCANLFSGGTAL